MVENLLVACCQSSVHEALKTKVSKERVNIELENMLEVCKYIISINLI